MRKSLVLLGVVVASLGLSACASTTKATIDTSIASLGAQSDLQIHFTASVTGSGTTEAQLVLGAVSLDTVYASTSGGPLSESHATSDSEVTLNVGSKPVLDLREIDSNIYVEFDLSAISAIPGIPLTPQDQSQIAAAQLFLGNKWFEVPSALIASELPSSDVVKAKTAQDQAIERKILDALSTLIEKGHATSLASGGYSETGTLESVLKAIEPIIAGLDPSVSTAGPVKGTYRLTLTNSGSVATGGSISITAPEGGASAGNATVTLRATVAHNKVAVVKPTNVTVITPALIHQLLGSTTSL